MANTIVWHDTPMMPNLSDPYFITIDSTHKKLSPERRKQAEVELGEDPRQRHIVVKAFRHKVEEMSLNCPTDAHFLLMFLRARKYNMERAAKMLKNYLKMRRNPTNCFHIPIMQFRHVMDQNMIYFLPDRDSRGCAILVFKAGMWNPQGCTMDELIRFCVGSLDILISDPDIQVAGVVAILDMKTLRFSQVRHFTPSHAKRLVAVAQDAFPARFKGIHIVNEPFVFDVMYAMAYPLLSEKIKSRIHFHGEKMSALHDHLSPDILPNEYGGKKTDIETNVFKSLGL